MLAAKERIRHIVVRTSDHLFYASIILSPAYLLRFPILGMPTNALDVLLALFIVLRLSGCPNIFSGVADYLKTRKTFSVGVTLIFVGLLAGVWAFPSAHSLGIVKSWFVLPAIASFLFLSSAGERQKCFLIDVMGVSGVIIAIAAAGYYVAQITTYDGRLRAWYESPNHLAMILAPCAVILWFRHCRGVLRRVLQGEGSGRIGDMAWIAACALVFVVIFETCSYGAWVSILASIFLGEMILMRGRLFLMARIATVVLFIVLALALTQAGSEKMSGMFHERSSFSSREMIWRAAWNIGSDNWLIGIGAGNFQMKYLEYQKFFAPYLEWAVPQPHNVFLAFWLQAGFLGTVGFLVLLVGLIFRLKGFLSRKQHTYLTQTKIAVLAAILCVVTHGLVDTTIWKNDLGLVWWTLVSLF